MKATIAAAALAALCSTAVHAQDMTFFVTSVGKGDGANLGGLEGADAHCNALAQAAGSKHEFHASLTPTTTGGDAGDSARDRIGKGPWRNAKGVVVAKNVNDLHSAKNNITKKTGLTRK